MKLLPMSAAAVRKLAMVRQFLPATPDDGLKGGSFRQKFQKFPGRKGDHQWVPPLAVNDARDKLGAANLTINDHDLESRNEERYGDVALQDLPRAHVEPLNGARREVLLRGIPGQEQFCVLVSDR